MEQAMSYQGVMNNAMQAGKESQLMQLQQKAFNAAGAANRDEQITKVAQEFEAMFINEMLRPMRESVEVDKLFGGGFAEETYRSMLWDEYGKEMSKTGQLGVAEMVKEQLYKYEAAMRGNPAIAPR